MTDTMYRQGDVLIVKTEEINGKPKKLDHLVVMEGELTGHHHQLVGDAVLFDDLQFKVNSLSELVHEEHATIQIPPGTYRVVRQREFDETNMARFVRD